jgi:hypothetical protein
MRRWVLAAVAAAMVAVPAAWAAPANEGALSAASPSYSWSGTAYGANIAGEPCNTDHSCEDTLLRVDDEGALTLKWTATAPAGPAWLGVTIMGSDAAGAEGDVVADGGGLEDGGTLTARLRPGHYLVRVAGLLTTLATYEMTATLKPKVVAAPPAPVPAAAPAPAAEPTPKPKQAKKAKCKAKKSKKGKKKQARCKRKKG